MNSLSLSDFQMCDKYSYEFDQTLCGRDQKGEIIGILHVTVNQENEKHEPYISDWSPGGKAYHVSGCNLHMMPDFKTLLEKNLILLHKSMEMIAFSGFDAYGKISKHSCFYGGKHFKYSSYIGNSLIHRFDNQISITSFKMLDKKTTESVKKTLMDIAWWFDKAPNETSKRQYEVIPRNQLSNKISQSSQPIISQTISFPSKTKALPSLPPKLSTNITSSNKPITSSPTITNNSTNSFKSIADFQGNNFDKDCETPPDQLLKTAIDLAKKEGYTKFEISNSFKKNIEVFPEAYLSKSNATYHKVKVDFYIDASNNFGKKCQLILQRQFFTCYADKTIVLSKISEAANNVLKSDAIAGFEV